MVLLFHWKIKRNLLCKPFDVNWIIFFIFTFVIGSGQLSMIMTFCYTLLWHLQMDVSWSLHRDIWIQWFNFCKKFNTVKSMTHFLFRFLWIKCAMENELKDKDAVKFYKIQQIYIETISFTFITRKFIKYNVELWILKK